MVEVRRTEPGRRGGGAATGSQGGGASADLMRAPFRKSCFHDNHGLAAAPLFGTLFW
jgi:hypothetical protein